MEITMTPAQVQQFTWALVQLSLVGGFLGALLLNVGSYVLRSLAEWLVYRILAKRRGDGGSAPMVGLSRATCPAASGGAGLARGSAHGPFPPPAQGDAQRRDKHGVGPRGAAPAMAQPPSSLEKPVFAAGGPAQALGARRDEFSGDSGTGSLEKSAWHPGTSSVRMDLGVSASPEP